MGKRILFCSTSGHGHLLPLLPLANAFAGAGHVVGFATASSWRERLTAQGFDLFPAGLERDVARARNLLNRPALLALPPAERRPHAFTHRFATLEAPERIRGLCDALAAFQPELIVFESGDLVAPLLAAQHGLPSIHHGFGRIVPCACFEQAAGVTAPLWRAAGLEPDLFAGAFRGIYVDICPPSLAPEAPPTGTHVELMRPAAAGAEIVEQTPVARAGADRPSVYVTLGTVFNELPLFRLILTGLERLDCSVVATIGEDNDPAELAPVPANARVERFVDQTEILPRCSAVVSHAGSGSMLGALAHGLPLLLLPQGADQFENAVACRAAGAARVLMPDEVTPGAVRAGVSELLAAASYAAAARRIAEEIRAMPTAAEIVPALLGA
jgi:UDP:flavonoid glycosyltransferase YjiC (YdhE family)